jgi:methylamine utilization protein MauE
MTGWLAALQPVPLAAVLVVSGRLKLASRTARARAAKSALGTIVGAGRAPAVYGALGAVELFVAALLVAGVPPALRTAGAGAAIALTAGFCGYLGYARLFVPDPSCGCVSARQAPITGRSFARAGLLLVMSVGMLAAGTGWPGALAAHPVPGIAVVLTEGVAIVLLSPEADRRWLWPLRRLWLRLRPHPLAGDAHDVPLASTLAQLRHSTAYRAVGTRLRSDVLDHWDSGEWRIVCYQAGPETAVFAVPRLRYEPDAVRVALVPAG